MRALDRSSAELPYVETALNYIDPTAADPGGINDIEREKSTLKLVSHPTRIYDARADRARLSLDRTGFVVANHDTEVTDFYDRRQVETIYHPEIGALIQELTGAETVLIFGTLIRNAAADAPAGSHKPVFNAHVDYNLETIRAVAERELPEGDKARYRHGRIILINTWRPIVEIESAPLAVADAATVAWGDLFHGPIGGKSQAGTPNAAGYNLAYNPNQRWYYVPRMKPSEMFVFKLCDSEPGAVQWAAHTSFEDPASPPDAAPRQSIELRTLALFPG